MPTPEQNNGRSKRSRSSSKQQNEATRWPLTVDDPTKPSGKRQKTKGSKCRLPASFDSMADKAEHFQMWGQKGMFGNSEPTKRVRSSSPFKPTGKSESATRAVAVTTSPSISSYGAGPLVVGRSTPTLSSSLCATSLVESPTMLAVGLESYHRTESNAQTSTPQDRRTSPPENLFKYIVPEDYSSNKFVVGESTAFSSPDTFYETSPVESSMSFYTPYPQSEHMMPLPSSLECAGIAMRPDTSFDTIPSVLEGIPSPSTYHGNDCLAMQSGSIQGHTSGDVVLPLKTGPHDVMDDAFGLELWPDPSASGMISCDVSSGFPANELFRPGRLLTDVGFNVSAPPFLEPIISEEVLHDASRPLSSSAEDNFPQPFEWLPAGSDVLQLAQAVPNQCDDWDAHYQPTQMTTHYTASLETPEPTGSVVGPHSDLEVYTDLFSPGSLNLGMESDEEDVTILTSTGSHVATTY